MIVKNIIFVGLIFLSTYFGSIFILLPVMPLLLLKHDLWRRWVDRIVGFWELFPIGLMHFFLGIEFRVHGDSIRCDDKAVIIMNHRTRLDWMFFWNALYKMDPWLVTSEKISLKSGLKNIPGGGWAMECNAFMFLSRDWSIDERIMNDLCAYYGWTKNPYQILIFPEGTDYCPKTIARSEVYSKENHLPNMINLLQPRTTGFVHLLKELKSHNAVDYIYDVTIGYPNSIVQTETDFALKGEYPERVDFSIKRYHLGKDVPTDNADQLTAWCRDVWSAKDKVLSQYYASSDPNKRNFHSSPVKVKNSTSRSKIVLFALIFWILSVCVWFYCIIMYFYFKLYVIFGTCVFMYIQKYLGGVEMLAIRWHKRSLIKHE